MSGPNFLLMEWKNLTAGDPYSIRVDARRIGAHRTAEQAARMALSGSPGGCRAATVPRHLFA
jgi:hypothetical protein